MKDHSLALITTVSNRRTMTDSTATQRSDRYAIRDQQCIYHSTHHGRRLDINTELGRLYHRHI
ncbi:MAG: hypothetical protein IPJ51_10385 [Saprospiraceae bacterium]|nr:hypothetical protein [Saprospiraceae bacterium]